MKDPAIRYEINRKVKATLTRHAVDLTLLQYSTAAEVVYLFGALKKDPEGDFSSSQVESHLRTGIRHDQQDEMNITAV